MTLGSTDIELAGSKIEVWVSKSELGGRKVKVWGSKSDVLGVQNPYNVTFGSILVPRMVQSGTFSGGPSLLGCFWRSFWDPKVDQNLIKLRSES